MDIYVILWAILQYYFIYQSSPTWAVLALSGGSCVPLTYLHNWEVFVLCCFSALPYFLAL